MATKRLDGKGHRYSVYDSPMKVYTIRLPEVVHSILTSLPIDEQRDKLIDLSRSMHIEL